MNTDLKLLALFKANPDIADDKNTILSADRPFADEQLNFYYDALKAAYISESSKLKAEIKAKKQLQERYEGSQLLREIRECGALSVSRWDYENQVKDDWAKRIIRNTGFSVSNCHLDPDSHEKYLDMFNGAIKAIDGLSDSSGIMTNNEIGEKTVERWISFIEGSNNSYIPSGMKNLDDLIIGFQVGTMSVIGARPSVGKTALGLSMMSDMDLAGLHTAFISVEMNEVQIFERLAQIRAGFSVRDELIGCGSGMGALTAEISTLKNNTSMHIRKTTDRRYSNVRKNIRQILKEDPEVKIIFIDYLQKIQSDNKGIDRRNSVGEISANLTDLAEDMGVSIVALAQLNRQSDGSKPPSMSELKESGDIEQDAHSIILIHRDLAGQMEANTTGRTNKGVFGDGADQTREDLQAVLKVAKNRDGFTGNAKTSYNSTTTKFTNYEIKYGGF